MGAGSDSVYQDGVQLMPGRFTVRLPHMPAVHLLFAQPCLHASTVSLAYFLRIAVPEAGFKCQ